MNKERLTSIIRVTWQGQVSFDNAVKGFTDEELEIMEKSINENRSVFMCDIPYLQDDAEYDDLLSSDKGVQLIQQMVDNLDSYSHFRRKLEI